jgi:hypothetical protein
MLGTLLTLALGVIAGAFLGWNSSQPTWAKSIQAKVQSLIAKKD